MTASGRAPSIIDKRQTAGSDHFAELLEMARYFTAWRHRVIRSIAKAEIADVSPTALAACVHRAEQKSVQRATATPRGVTRTISQPGTSDQILDTQRLVRRSTRLAPHPGAARSKGRCRRLP